MSETSLPGVEAARFDVVLADYDDAGLPPDGLSVFPEPAYQPATAPLPVLMPSPDAPSRKRRRNLASGLLKLLRRLWIPLVILAVLLAGGFTVWRLHGIFGSEKALSYGDSKPEEAQPFNPKHLRYEVFGSPGSVAELSYFDANGDPVHARAELPWSLEFPIGAATGIGSIAAQGDGDTIGCRIIVDDQVKAEKTTSHEVSAFVSCLLKAA